MTINISKDTKKLLIVEGKDEDNFFDAALKTHLIITDIQIMPIGGKTQLKSHVKALKLDPLFPNIESIAIVRDADSNLPGEQGSPWIKSFESVKNSLKSNDLPVPMEHGVFVPGPPKIGVFIMPDGRSDGMLETLCMRSVQSYPEYACVEGYLDCLSMNHLIPGNLDKARSHVWLASRTDPGKRVGEAALSGYWEFTSSAFNELWRFIRSI